jgi:hypothetical protein
MPRSITASTEPMTLEIPDWYLKHLDDHKGACRGLSVDPLLAKLLAAPPLIVAP